MKCPFCGKIDSRVVDSRDTEDGLRIRRRRECLSCQKRFTTYEALEISPLMVLKKDGTMQMFDRDKLFRSMARACDGRHVTPQQLNVAVMEIEMQLQNSLQQEITTVSIGEMVMEKLKKIDEPSYVRYASVYRQFKDINSFVEEVTKMLKNN